MNVVPVASVILTFNEEKNIETCLQSVAGWCQQIIVVDSGSTDRTLDICRKYTGLIFPHPYIDHASQWDWSLKNLPLECDWVLRLDADDLVSEELKRQVEQVMVAPEPDVSGYYVVHRHYFRNKPIHGLKTHWLCLIRHKNIRIDHSELVDFRFIVDGKTRNLSGSIIESNQKELEIDFWLDKHQKFSSRMAAEEVLRRAGVLRWSISGRLLGNPDERMIWFKNIWYHMPLFVRPFIYFTYRYFFRLGLLDGVNGFVYHFLQAFWFRLVVDIKISELNEEIRNGTMTLEQLQSSFAHSF